MRKKKNEKTKEQGKVKRTEQEYMVIGKKKEKDKDSKRVHTPHNSAETLSVQVRTTSRQGSLRLQSSLNGSIFSLTFLHFSNGF